MLYKIIVDHELGRVSSVSKKLDVVSYKLTKVSLIGQHRPPSFESRRCKLAKIMTNNSQQKLTRSEDPQICLFELDSWLFFRVHKT